MKYYTFKRESNDFTDILKDKQLSKHIKTKIRYHKHLIIGLSYETDDSILGMLVLKYGEELVPTVNKDYTPKPYIDYVPKRNK